MSLQIGDKFIFNMIYYTNYSKELQNILIKQDVYNCSEIIRLEDNSVYLIFENFPLPQKIFLYNHFIKFE